MWYISVIMSVFGEVFRAKRGVFLNVVSVWDISVFFSVFGEAF